MENPNGVDAEHDAACGRVARLFQRPWLRTYARGKLRRDAIYSTAYEMFRASPHPLLDVGCGLGLLGLYLRERGCRHAVLGLDADRRKIEFGSAVASSGYEDLEVRHHDIRNGLPAFSGNVALFDVLHYLPVDAQRSVLARLSERVAPGGILLIRDCPCDRRPRFWITWLAEKFAQTIRWNLDTTLHFPSRASIDAPFPRDQFGRETRPLWGGSPFNNHLFVFRRVAAATVPAAVSRNGTPARSIHSASPQYNGG